MKQLVVDRTLASRFNVLMSILFISHCYSFLAGGVAYGSIGASPSLGEMVPDKMIYVNNQHPDASDSSKGDRTDSPVKTIGNAAKMAMRNQEKGFSTKIIIYPGTYREQIKLNFRNRKQSPPIVFEAKEKGTVIVSGSDVWTDWEELGETNVYVHPWPKKWGFMPGPSQLTQKYGPIVRRREMIFVDHKPMNQVLSFDDLKKDTFYVSEEESKVYLSPTSKLHLPDAIVEVAIRSDIFEITRGQNVVVRGITFQHDTTGMSTLGGAVHFIHSNNILIEDCKIVWNNWFGLRFTEVNNVTTRRNRENHNGGAGWVGWKIKDLLSEGDETSYNNWRGVSGNFLGWEIAGVKHHAVHDAIYRNYKAIGNQTRGFWLDYDNERIQIEEACICDNLVDGINLEASQGPIRIKDSRVCNNRNYGINAGNSSNITLEGNQLYGNNKSQIALNITPVRMVENWQTGARENVRGVNWILKRNSVSAALSSFLVDLPGDEQFLNSLLLQENVWSKEANTNLFRIGGKQVDLVEWQHLAGRNPRSTLTPAFQQNTRNALGCEANGSESRAISK